MLGSDEASKIRADVDAKRTRGMISESRMEKCAQSVLLLLNLPELVAPGNLDLISTNTSYLTLKRCPQTIIRET